MRDLSKGWITRETRDRISVMAGVNADARLTALLDSLVIDGEPLIPTWQRSRKDKTRVACVISPAVPVDAIEGEQP